jgi:hypothetical protein
MSGTSNAADDLRTCIMCQYSARDALPTYVPDWAMACVPPTLREK